MKILKKLLILLLILLLLLGTFIFLIGFGYYSKTLNEKSLTSRVEEVTSKEHFVSFEQLPKNYINAVIAVEDHRYYEHGPVDFITQQVAKNIIFNQDKTLIRKIGEIFGAYDLEKNYSKDEILALYVNSNYFGDGYYGIYAASMGYYKKEPKDLTLEEASMLAGIPNAPSVYSPSINPNLAKKRQSHVLNAMVQYGYITEEEANSIK